MDISDSFFNASMSILSYWEGGFVDDPDDVGGRTNLGITQFTYDNWRQNNTSHPKDVKAINEATAYRIYRELFWDKCGASTGCERYSFSLAYCLFDTAVQFGASRAVVFLQEAVNCYGGNLVDDGVFGPKTAKASMQVDGAKLVKYISTRRMIHRIDTCQAHPSQRKFLGGWLRRDRSLLEV